MPNLSAIDEVHHRFSNLAERDRRSLECTAATAGRAAREQSWAEKFIGGEIAEGRPLERHKHKHRTYRRLQRAIEFHVVRVGNGQAGNPSGQTTHADHRERAPWKLDR